MEKRDDPWEILAVPRSASEAEVKKAFRKGALKYHPDKQHTEEEKVAATKIFTKLSEAYQILSDPVKCYDWKQAEEKRKRPARNGARIPFKQSSPSRSSTYMSSHQSNPARAHPRARSVPHPHQRGAQRPFNTGSNSQYPAPHRNGASLSPRRRRASVTGIGPRQQGAAPEVGRNSHQQRASVFGRGPSSPGPPEMGRKGGRHRHRSPVAGHSPPPQSSPDESIQFGGSRHRPETRHSMRNLDVDGNVPTRLGEEEAPSHSPTAAWRRQYWKSNPTPEVMTHHDPFDIFDQVMKEEFGKNYRENDDSGWQAAVGVPGLAKLKSFKRTSMSAGKEFKKLDIDKSKSISKGELEKFIESHADVWKTLSVGLGFSEEECIRIGTDVAFALALGEGIKRPPTNEFRRRKWEISKEEFKCFHKNYVEDEDGSHEFYLRTLFAVFDINSDGVLNASELDKFFDVFYNAKDMFRGKTKLPAKSELLKVARKRLDLNRDGVLQFNEIRDLLHVAAVVATVK